MHAIGDRANREALDAFESTREVWAPLGLRQRIEHAQCLAPEDVGRFAELGVACSVQFSHAPSDRDLADRFWPDKAGGAYAFRSLWDSGAVVANGSDAPVEELDPLAGIRAGVLRTIDDRPAWHPDERLTVEQALLASTVNPAWLAGDERSRGRLLPGYLADLVVLTRDPLECPEDELESVRGRGDDGRRPLGAQPAALELTIERETFDRSEGRHVFGPDAAGYHRARPGHPDRVYEVLVERCGLGPGAVVLEIGPGTGQATRRLLERRGGDGSSRSSRIRSSPRTSRPSPTAGRRSCATTLEDAALPPADVRPRRRRVVVPLGRREGADSRSCGAPAPRRLVGDVVDSLRRRLDDRIRSRDAIDPVPGPSSPRAPAQAASHATAEAALAALADAGFERGRARAHPLEPRMGRGRASAASSRTFSPIARLEPYRRDEILDEIARIAEDDFGGRVVKPLHHAALHGAEPGRRLTVVH